MSKARDEKREACIDARLKEFEDYDNALTAVASWRAILEAQDYHGRLTYFDWFPRIPTKLGTQHVNLTPDLTALLEADAGLILDVKASMPKDDEAFDSELADLLRYDHVDQLRDSPTTYRPLRDAAIIVMLDRNNSSVEIASRIITRLHNPDHVFKPKRQIVLMDFAFMETRGKTFFDIRCIPIERNGRFPNVILTDHFVTNHKPARMAPTLFGPYKSQFVVMNDEPMPITLLVFLWGRVLYELLTAGQRKQFSAGEEVAIPCTPADVIAAIRRIHPQASVVSEHKAKVALRDLVRLELGRALGDDDFEINFRDLCRNKRSYRQSGKQEQEIERELAHEFARRLCKAPGDGLVQETLNFGNP